jgi:hypothetical protein
LLLVIVRPAVVLIVIVPCATPSITTSLPEPTSTSATLIVVMVIGMCSLVLKLAGVMIAGRSFMAITVMPWVADPLAMPSLALKVTTRAVVLGLLLVLTYLTVRRAAW